MSDERPYLEIPLPSAEDQRLFEEWKRRQEKDELEDDENERVVIINT